MIAWAANNRLLATLATVAVLVVGLWVARHLPIDAVPDVTNTQVQVVTRAPALSATEVETFVTQPVERRMAGTPGLKSMRSITKLGISIVTLVFDDTVDTYFARAQVGERLDDARAEIPEEIGRPELGPISTALGEIYMFELKPADDRRSPEELRTMIDWQIGPRLRQVPGVIEVIGFGGSRKEYHVTLDPSRMAALAISPEEVKDALAKDNRVAGGGYLEADGEQLVLSGDARFRGIEDISATVVRTDRNGSPIRVGQLATVDTGPALRQGAMTRDGHGEIVGASVLMLKGANSREVVAKVKDKIAEISPHLPNGVTIVPYYDRADFIGRVLDTIGHNLGEGAIIVVLCLLVTLGSIRAGLLVAGTIPFAMLVGMIGLYFLGYSGNVMSLGAVDFGIIVEGVVVLVEHALAHGASEQDKKKRAEKIVHAMQEMARPSIFVVVITILTFAPLATLEDVEGKMFRPVVLSLCFMLAGAVFYALVFVPSVAPFLLHQKSDREPMLVRGARRIYAPLLDWTLRRPLPILGAALVASGLAFTILGGKLGADFLPRMFEGTFAIDAARPPSTSLDQAIELSKESQDALREAPEVDSVISRIGRPEGAADPAGPESSDEFVTLKPKDQWRPGMTPDKLMDDLSGRVNKRVPATISAFSQPIEMRVNDLVAGVRSDIAVKVYGEDLAEMGDAADKIRRALAAIPGATDFRQEIPLGQPTVTVKVDRSKIARIGASPSDVLDALTMARAGMVVGTVHEGERVFDLTLKIGGDTVKSAEDIERLPIPTANGTLIPLEMVASVEEDRGVVQISRDQMRRRLVVQGNVRGRDMIGFVDEAQKAVAKLDLPKNLELEWGGQFQNFNRAKGRLMILAPIALGIIGLLLIVTFGRAIYSFITLLNLPIALAGGIA
ncbi:MAG TPA: CusA/CzcA family heavy metal efflux RND transporter, partial [Polyangiaceae bacterium]